MGNAISVKTQNYFYTSCMAKYTNVTKPQVMAIRNLLVLLSQESSTMSTDVGPIMIQRKHLQKAIQKVNLAKDPDHDIIDLIFTMWCSYDDSSHGKDADIVPPQSKKSTSKQVPWYEFLISISLLACKTDTFEQSIRFTLYVVHRNHFFNSNNNNANAVTNKTQQGYISSSDAVSFLQGLCTTAAFYGDTHTFHNQQIHEIVDRIYDSITRVTFENLDDNSIQQKDLSFNEFVKAFLHQQDVRDIVVLPLPSKQMRMHKTKSKGPVSDVGKSKKTSRMTRKSAMNMTPIYDFDDSRDDDSIVKIRVVPASPKSPKSQYNDKNTNKYMPLIDEIEKDARKKMKHSSYPSFVKGAVEAKMSSSNDDNDAIDPDCIHVTTTEEDYDDANDDDNSLEENENLNDDAILTTLKANSKVISSLKKSLKQQYAPKNSNSIHLYSMADSDTNISPASQSVLSTDLSSHMSSVMLKPVARVRLE